MLTAEYNTSQFFYENKEFSQEASSLEIDRMPNVILLTSEHTGTTRKFILQGILRDGTPDNEIIGWEYREPIPFSMQGLRITIHND